MPLNIDGPAALFFANQLRSAREAATKDAEAFDAVIHAVERLGSFLSGKVEGLGGYKDELKELCDGSSGPAAFDRLYSLVQEARNDALHQGAFARHLTLHAIELAVRLEDALRISLDPRIENYMVRNPVCAQIWQPIGLIRQQMLSNSFSFMPVKDTDGDWRLVSDAILVAYLRQATSKNDRKRLLANKLGDTGVRLIEPQLFLPEQATLEKAVSALATGPILIYPEGGDQRTLVGILTAFDLL